MILHRSILLFSLLGSSTVLAINYPLSQAEEALLYSRLKSPLDVEAIYQILLQSNRVDDPKLLRKDSTKRKVNIRVSPTSYSSFAVSSVFNQAKIFSMHRIFPPLSKTKVSLVRISDVYYRS